MTQPEGRTAVAQLELARSDRATSAWRRRTTRQYAIGRAVFGVPVGAAAAHAAFTDQLQRPWWWVALLLASATVAAVPLARRAQAVARPDAAPRIALALLDAATLLALTLLWHDLAVPALPLFAAGAVFHGAMSGPVSGTAFVITGVGSAAVHLSRLRTATVDDPLVWGVLVLATLFVLWVSSTWARSFLEMQAELEEARSFHEHQAALATRAEAEAVARTTQADAHLEALHGARERLLRMASHELRTPLTAVLGALEVLEEHGGSLGDDRRHALLSVARRSATDLAHVSEQVLDLVRLTDEDNALGQRPFDLEAVVEGGLARQSLGLAGREVRVTSEPVRSCGDASATARIVENLLSNVVQHTPPATPVHIRVREDGDATVLEVRDEGPGLPPNATEPFTRGDENSPARGLGIGLTLCLRYAEAQGGSFEVVGSPTGTTATLRLPLAPPEPARPADHGSAAVAGDLRVVEDRAAADTLSDVT